MNLISNGTKSKSYTTWQEGAKGRPQLQYCDIPPENAWLDSIHEETPDKSIGRAVNKITDLQSSKTSRSWQSELEELFQNERDERIMRIKCNTWSRTGPFCYKGCYEDKWTSMLSSWFWWLHYVYLRQCPSLWGEKGFSGIQYLGVMGHQVGNLLSDGLGKKVACCTIFDYFGNFEIVSM